MAAHKPWAWAPFLSTDGLIFLFLDHCFSVFLSHPFFLATVHVHKAGYLLRLGGVTLNSVLSYIQLSEDLISNSVLPHSQLSCFILSSATDLVSHRHLLNSLYCHCFYFIFLPEMAALDMIRSK